MPVLAAHCTKCHGAEKQKAKINFDSPRTLEQMATDSELWFRMREQIESGVMPPEDEKPLAPEESRALTGWVDGEFTNLLVGVQQREGRSKFRRLNRNEYANTIQDLFGFRPAVVRDLPGDARVNGYDKVSAALPLSSAGAAGYVQIAERVLIQMFRQPPRDFTKTTRLYAVASEQSPGHILELPNGWKVSFNTDTTSVPLRKKNAAGEATADFSAATPGMHRVRIFAYGYQTDKPMLVGIYAGHTVAYPQLIDLVKVVEVPPGKPAVIETEVYLRTREFNDTAPVSDSLRLIPFGLGVQVPKNSLASKCKGPGLAVQWVDVDAPELPLPGDRWLCADMPPAMQEVFRQPDGTLKSGKFSRDELLSVMRTTFQRVAARFFRRDVTEAELNGIMASFTEGIDAGEKLGLTIRSELLKMMTSPDFLCVIERPGRLTDFALASRLSYFLWNSTPDEELLDIAHKHQLQNSTVLAQQTERMLKSPKSERFTKDFVDQWLNLRAIGDTTPDTKLYPEFDELLKISSVMETQATFRRIMDKNLSVREFVAPKWALVNERLARHYGLPEVKGFDLKEVAIPADSPFGGIWTQSAVMKVTANGTGTSPVKRGVWVSERLLGIHIPPPPPSVEPINPDTRGAKTLREQLELHRKGSCSACHAKFDPYGFALESFDVTGAFRTKYREADPDVAKLQPQERKGRPPWRDGLPVDCTGKTPDGVAFTGVQQLRQLLANKTDQLARGVTRHLVTYATGAPVTRLDEPAINAIVQVAEKSDYGLRTLIHLVIQSDLFRNK